MGSQYGFFGWLEDKLKTRANFQESRGNAGYAKGMRKASERIKDNIIKDLEGKIKWKYILFQRSWIALRNKALEQGMETDELERSLRGLRLE